MKIPADAKGYILLKHLKVRSEEEHMVNIWTAGSFAGEDVSGVLRRLHASGVRSSAAGASAFLEEDPEDDRDPYSCGSGRKTSTASWTRRRWPPTRSTRKRCTTRGRP